MSFVFWLSIFLIFFAYIGYPLSLWAWVSFFRKHIDKQIYHPSVSLIIAACNEEARIRDKIDNTLALTYPKESLQVIVTSDGSTDKTNSIVSEYQDRGIELLVIPERGGKENAQMEAVKIASGEVLIFSDVATRIEPDGLEKIVSNFADASVGCVSSVDRVIGRDGKPCGEGAYVRYEMWLRSLESQVSSLVGLSGSFFAARREVCQDFSPEMQSDFRTVLNSMRLGLRGVSDSESIGFYQDIADNRKEFDRKVRTVLRGQTVFFRNLEFLNLFRYGIFSYQYFCHKLLRWLVPFFLLIAFVSNMLLAAGSTVYFALFMLHIAFYGLALWGRGQGGTPNNILVTIPLYFLTVNAAILMAWLKYLKGNRMVMWTPSSR